MFTFLPKLNTQSPPSISKLLYQTLNINLTLSSPYFPQASSNNKKKKKKKNLSTPRLFDKVEVKRGTNNHPIKHLWSSCVVASATRSRLAAINGSVNNFQ